MKSNFAAVIALAMAACTAGSAFAQHASHDHGAATPANATVSVRTPDGKTLSVTADLLKGLPRHSATQTFHGETHTYEGPLLASVLAKAGAPVGEKLRGPELATAVLVRARDGYTVALSMGEIDPAISGAMILLADTADGKAIPAADGPYRLVIAGDKVAARSARMVESIEVKRVE